jgi:hypothetical protein
MQSPCTTAVLTFNWSVSDSTIVSGSGLGDTVYFVPVTVDVE